MQLGNPTGATADPNNHSHYLIQRTVETIDYSDANGQPNWASWDLTSSDLGSSGRSDAWATDTSLPSGFKVIPTSTYGSVGGQSYDRGHMCPSADRTDTVADNDMVFIMSNIIPQASAQNEGVWAAFENYCRSLVSTQELLITCGPYNFGPNYVDSGLVGVASNTFKIAVCVPLGTGTRPEPHHQRQSQLHPRHRAGNPQHRRRRQRPVDQLHHLDETGPKRHGL